MELRILGPLEAVDDSGSLLRLGGRKQRLVLAALALSTDVVPADRLIDLVWRDDPPARPEATLQVYLSTLRKVLGGNEKVGPWIIRQPPGYRLRLPPDSLDLRRFEDLLREGRQAIEPEVALDRWESATGLWRGPLLADLSDESFVQVAAVRVQEQRREAVVATITTMMTLGRLGESIAALEGLTAQEPGEERLWALLMTALYRIGRPTDAGSAYLRAREALIDQTGMDPSPALVDLQERILRHDPTLTVASPESVVTPTATSRGAEVREVAPFARSGTILPSGQPLWSALGAMLFGREDLVVRVDEILAGGVTVTLTGPAGVGKSAVAAAIARRWSAAGRQVQWLSLDDRVRAGEVTATIASLLDLSLIGLLVIDGGDDQAADLRDFLAGLSRTVLLVRGSPLGIPDERPVEVPPLEVAAARELFEDRARRVRPLGSDLIAPALADEICAAVDHLPLGVELAAAQLRTMSPLDLKERLTANVDRLGDADRAGPARHRSLGAAFAGAVAALGEEYLDDLVQLTVFRGGWNLEAHRAVLGGDAVARLDALVRSGLVWPDRSGLRFRYRMPTAVRDLVLDGRQVRESTHRAHAVHFAGEARRWRSQRRGYEGRQAAASLALDGGNVVAGFLAALAAEDDFAAAVGLSVGNLFYTPARMSWLDARLGELVERQAGRGADRYRLMVMFGHTQYLRGHEDNALLFLRQSVQELDPDDDLAIRGRTLLAQIAVDRGDPAALNLVVEAVAAAEMTGRPVTLTQTLDAAILVAIMSDDIDRARDWALDKLDLEIARRDDFGRSFTTLRLAWIAYLSEDDAQARSLAQEAIELARVVDAQVVEMYATAILGQSLLVLDPAAALPPLVSSALDLVDEQVPLDVADALLAVAAACACRLRRAARTSDG